MFIAMATAICSLEHWLCLTARTRSTQPCIPLRSLNRVPASARIRAGMSPLPGGRQCCDDSGFLIEDRFFLVFNSLGCC